MKVKGNGAAVDLFERLAAIARAEELPDPIPGLKRTGDCHRNRAVR